MMRDHEPSCSSFDDCQSWLQRTSPPGSPSHKCCYEQKVKSFAKGSSLLCCCYVCPGTRSSSILATLGVCCLLLSYTFVGAITFMVLEGDLYQDTAVAASKSNPQSDTTRIGKIRNDTVNRLWSITEDLNILYRENWTKLAAEEVMEFQEKLFKELSGSTSAYSEHLSAMAYHSQHKWSFSSSFLYSLTLITTIGYGSVSPRTTWGKLFTILYALVGIPLMLLYLSTTGDLLARSFRRLYGKLWWKTKKSAERHNAQSKCQCSNTVKVPISLCLVIILAYICSGAVLFHRLENWSLLEGSYFCFTSLGTIGFGDLLPGQKTEEISLCACSAYILTGMAILAMCFSLIQDEVSTFLRLVVCGTCPKKSQKLKDPESVSVLETP